MKKTVNFSSVPKSATVRSESALYKNKNWEGNKILAKDIIKKLICVILLKFVIITSSYSDCPACLGSIGLALRGLSSSALSPFESQFRYRYERQSYLEYYRNLNIAQFSFFRNFDKISFGFILPLSFANGFMSDGKMHRIRSLYGLDFSLRYFPLKAPFTPSRPVLSILTSVKIPIGYIYHEEHEPPKIPYVFTFGIGFATNMNLFTFAIEGYYSRSINKDEHYQFSDRGAIYISITKFLANKFTIGANMSILWQKGDVELLNENVPEYTKRLTFELGPRALLWISDQLSVDLSGNYIIPASWINTPQNILKPKWSAEIGLTLGFQ